MVTAALTLALGAYFLTAVHRLETFTNRNSTGQITLTSSSPAHGAYPIKR